METFGTIIMLIVILAFFTFMMIINAIAKILGGGTGKIAATGFVGFLLLKFFGPKLEKLIEEYHNSQNK
jgi:hypothetical protein|uniref:Uncharacterized protein n=1 Tax=Siphoviridae sp. ctcK97 TaxID=2825571 RepID=A0A8S5UAV5_9CAUD|nr:MAG TPA: hypothetical protein [Siphoviridae sp. ctcK97]